MRDPSIHVKKSDFKQVIKSMFDISNKDIDLLVLELRKYSCDQRSVAPSNKKLTVTTKRTLESNKGDAMLVSELIYSVRISLKHKGVKRIKEGDRDWLMVKELAGLCNNFSNDFDFSDKRSGFAQYIKMGLTRINSFKAYLPKLISMYESICVDYDSLKELNSDPDKEATKRIHDLFVNKVASKTGIYETHINNPTKMYAFYKAKLMCQECGVDPEDFISAQFEALDWCNGMPTPESLTNNKSKERLQRYLFENNIKVNTNEDKQEKAQFWAKIKQGI